MKKAGTSEEQLGTASSSGAALGRVDLHLDRIAPGLPAEPWERVRNEARERRTRGSGSALGPTRSVEPLGGRPAKSVANQFTIAAKKAAIPHRGAR